MRFQNRLNEQPVDTHRRALGTRYHALMGDDSDSDSSDSEEDDDGNFPAKTGRYNRVLGQQSRKVKCELSCNGDWVFPFSQYLLSSN